MKSIVFSRTGDSSVLQLVDREVPDPGPGEVRVRIVVSGVNPTDWKARWGKGDGAPTAFDEITPNQDGSGVVDAVGPGVDGLAVGDRVWVLMAAQDRPTGTAQEFTVLPADRVVPLPDGVSFDVGASLGVPAVTAHRALTVAEDGPSVLSPGALAGRTVLVTGGAGAVGHAAIQLARWAGAEVVTTISGDRKALLARAAGAQHIVNYREQDVPAVIRGIVPDGVDLVVDVALAANVETDLQVIRPTATVVSYTDDGGATVTLDMRQNMALNTRFQFLLMYTMGEAALRAAAQGVTAALRDGVLPVGEENGLPLLRFSLADTAAAHDAVENGAVGKVLIDVAGQPG